jgi:hypothetical protein
MAVINVRTYQVSTGKVVPGTALRTGAPQEAVDRAIDLNRSYPAPEHITKIHFAGEFVEEAFAELTQLAQQHGLDVETGEG